MDNLYRSQIYPVLAKINPERAHHLALIGLGAARRVPAGLRLLHRLAGPADPRLQVKRFGLIFPNPLGVAAGLDKDAEAVASLFALGFGSVEVGTVTPRPQPGNPPPRLWRFPEQGALVNALGFPSEGAAAVRERLVGHRFPGVVGINLGKNRATPADRAAEDYVAVLGALWDQADYITVNVSSPNTPGLRDLQQREALTALLNAVAGHNHLAAELHRGTPRPVLVKIAPDLDDAALDDVLAGASDGGVAGIIVANTTTTRDGLPPTASDLPGGMSGQPLRERATAMVRRVYQRTGGHLPIVGVGGISNANDVIERMRAGASLVQIYTAFIYGGPALPGTITRDLIAFIEREGLQSIEEIVGA